MSEFKKGKIKFLAVKLSALQAELKVSKEILASASREVNAMFKRKYFPEVPQAAPPEEPPGPIAHPSDEVKESENKQETHQTQQENEKASDTAEEEERIEISEKDVDPEVKKLFRRIALKIHPDKLLHLNEGYEKEKKEKLYLKAVEAMDNNDLLAMADVAIDIDLEVPEIDEIRLKKTESKIKDIKKELEMIESTVVWHWFFCTDPEQKDKILSSLFEAMYANHTRS